MICSNAEELGDTVSFKDEGSMPNENIICWMDDNHYYDNKGNVVTEASIAKLFHNEYYKIAGYEKKGFTADGNTRLIMRALTNAPGKVRFSAPVIGVTFENLNREEGQAYSMIEIPTVLIGDNQYQSSAVMISPKDYPTSSTYPFPNSKFNVHVTFVPSKSGQAQISQDIPVEIYAVPVVLIHGFGTATTVDNTFGDENAKTGIRRKLLDEGFKVYPCEYNSKLGPLTVIPDASLESYTDTPIFSNFAEALKNFARDTDGIACTRVDIVAHSMGGLMSRRFIQDDKGNLNTIRSYKQGMVRRLITVGTPHEGSPYANWLLNGDLPMYWKNSLWNIARDEWLAMKLSAVGGNSSLGLVYQTTFKGTDDALYNFSIGSPLFKILKDPTVPVCSLYGKITGQKWEAPEHEKYKDPYMGALPLQFWMPVIDKAEYE